MQQPIPHPDVADATEPGLDRATWLIVGGVVALLLLGLIVAFLAARRESSPDVSTPGGVVLAYELALQRGEPDVAWQYLTSSVQAGLTKQAFVTRAGTSARGTDAQYDVSNLRADGDVAHLDLLRTTASDPGPFNFGGSGSTTVRSAVTLQRENGAWRISVPPEPYLVLPRPGGG